jgi:hypothetical protein
MISPSRCWAIAFPPAPPFDCSATELPFGRQFLDDVTNRTQTAMPQERCFNAMKLALTAQAMAEQGTEWQQ